MFFQSPCTTFVLQMKRLALHIELLLRDNDCVVLPGFGGIICHNQPAYYLEKEHLYYPPSRAISFNAALNQNDGLLVQSYMQKYKIGYAKASLLVDAAVETLLDALFEDGEATLAHIGTFRQDIHGAIQFIPYNAGIESPILYGLSSFCIYTLSELQHQKNAADTPKKVITQSEKTISLHIDKRFVRQLINTAAAILLLLTISLPTGRHGVTDMASALQLLSSPTPTEAIAETPIANLEASCTAVKMTTTEVAATEISEVPEAPEVPVATPSTTTSGPSSTSKATAPVQTSGPTIAQPAASEPVATEAPMPIAEKATPEKTYHIIVASLPNHRGADELLSKYSQKGYSNVQLVERDSRIRISIKQFTNKNAANNELNKLRENPDYEYAWILAVRNN